jgi:hypothetical protein
MPKIGTWPRENPLISWEKLGAEALNSYNDFNLGWALNKARQAARNGIVVHLRAWTRAALIAARAETMFSASLSPTQHTM